MNQVLTLGLSPKQEPKYNTTPSGKLINRTSGVVIPDEEPVMVFRAKDKRAVAALWGYHDSCVDTAHRAVIKARIAEFEQFAKDYPERMKEPDTAAPAGAVEHHHV